MEELEYSPLLRRLIEKATELDGGPNHKLTAEGFIAAVVCYVRDVSDPDSQRLKNMLKLKLPTAISDPNNIATDFILHATSKATPESRRIDESYIEGCLKKARCIAASEGSGEVHAYQLLKCILDEPNDFIRNYIVSMISSRRSRQCPAHKRSRMLTHEYSATTLLKHKNHPTAENARRRLEKRHKKYCGYNQKNEADSGVSERESLWSG